MARIVDKVWFNNSKGALGIIVIEEDITQKKKAYISAVEGRNEAIDTQNIIDYGSTFSLEVVKRLKHHLEDDKVIMVKRAGR